MGVVASMMPWVSTLLFEPGSNRTPICCPPIVDTEVDRIEIAPYLHRHV